MELPPKTSLKCCHRINGTRAHKTLSRVEMKLIYFLYSEGFEKKIAILISSAALCTRSTLAIDFKTLP
jgi:hypothetical protein